MISSDAESEVPDPPFGPGGNRPAVLVATDPGADIAVFRAEPLPEQDMFNSVQLSQLYAIPSPLPKQPAFTVTYCADDEELNEEERNIADAEVCCEVARTIYNTPTATRYDLIRHWAVKSVTTLYNEDIVEMIKKGRYKVRSPLLK